MKAKRFNIAVETTDEKQFSAIVRKCRKAGLDVSAELGELGVISGAGQPELAEQLRSIPGVTSVEEDRDVRAI